jgi:hypothetical protein
VGHAGFENPFGCRDVPCIGHLESFPKAAPDAAAAIAPGEAAGESEFGRGLVVEAVLPDFFSDFFAADEVRCGVVFPRKLIEEGVRVLNFSFHSPTLEPGHTPYVRDESDRTAFYGWWDRVLSHLARRGVAAVSLGQLLDAIPARGKACQAA